MGDTRMLPTPPPNLRLPSTRAPSLLPSKPTKWPYKLTDQVSSPPDVEPSSITVSSPLVTEPSTAKTTSSSRTPGVQDGETKVTSESDKTTSAVSSSLPHTHTNEHFQEYIDPEI